MGYTQELHRHDTADDTPAWLAAAIKRRDDANAAETQKRRTDAAAQAETINATLRELGITPIDSAHWTPGGHLVHARLIRPYQLGEEWGVTAGLHDGVVSVFVDSGDDEYPALTKHSYVCPLTNADDVLNAAYGGPPTPAQPVQEVDHATEAKRELQRADTCEFGSDKERSHLGAAQVHATLATLTDRATVADLRYRLAAIARLITPAAQLTDGPAALLASAVHEIARSARTPEAALELVPPEFATILSGLTR